MDKLMIGALVPYTVDIETSGMQPTICVIAI